jgi:ribosomal protein L33
MTEDNIYRQRNSLVCAECKRMRARIAYSAKVNPPQAPTSRTEKNAFCEHCRVGGCGNAHRRGRDRCLRVVSSSIHAHACSCGSAWAITWKRTIALEAKRSRRIAYSLKRQPR